MRPAADFDVIGRDRLPTHDLAQPHHRRCRPAGRPCRRRQARLRRHRRACSTAAVVGERRRARRRAGHARDRPARSGADGRAASTPSCCPAARPSASMPPPACRPGCASRAAASQVRDGARADRAGRDPVRPAVNGGDKNWGRYPPYRELGYEAAASAGADFALGSVGAGLGATTVNLKGGIGSASAHDARRHHRRRAGGGQRGRQRRRSATVRISGRRRSSRTSEFGGRGWPATVPGRRARHPHQRRPAREHHHRRGRDRREARPRRRRKRLAVMAQDGLARAIYPVHTPLDGDMVFAAATGAQAARRSGLRAGRARHARRQCAGARHRARRL